jgi:hypothetical protein
MNELTNNVFTGISAGIYYFKSAVSLLVSNPWFLGLSVLMLLSAGKSFKIGKILDAKG